MAERKSRQVSRPGPQPEPDEQIEPSLPRPVRGEDRDQARYERDMAERARPSRLSEADVEQIHRDAPHGHTPGAQLR